MKPLTEAQIKVFNVCKNAMLNAKDQNYKVLTYDELKKACINEGLKSFDSSFNALYLKGCFFRYPDLKTSDGFLLSKNFNF